MLESIIPAGPMRSASCERHGDFVSRQAGPIWTSCPACQRDQINAETRQRIAAQAGARRVALLANAKIPAKFAAARLQGEHAAKLIAWADQAMTDQVSLVLLGGTGTGKTHIACGLLQALVDRGVSCRYVTAAGFLTRITSTWDGGEDETERQVFAEFVAPRVLVLDDIGASSGSEALRLKIGQLIDERYLDGKSTVLISNLQPEALRTELGDRAYSRALENVTQIVVKGKDRRRAA